MKMDSSPSTTSGGSSTSGTSKKGSWLDALQMNPKMYWPRKYRFTIEPMPGSVAVLSVKERDFYEANGFVIMKSLLPIGKNQILSTLAKSDLSNSEEINRLVTQYSVMPQLLKYVECFTGSNIMAVALQIHPGNSTVPATSTEEAMNNITLCQDSFSLPIRPADKLVCAVTVLNGSKESPVYFTVVPGSHKSGNLTTIESKNDFTLYEPIKDFTKDPRKQLQLLPGDTIFYHPQLSHSSGLYSLNLSEKESESVSPPLAISRYFASSECNYVEMSGNESVINKELGNHPYDYWKNNAQLVRGIRSRL